MMPQSSFMVLAAIDPNRETELRALLDSMNEAPGRVNQTNPLVPFARLEMLHFARFVILHDETIDDVKVYNLQPQTYPLYLAFLGDIDGNEKAFLRELATVAADGLRKILSCCIGFPSGSDLVRWMQEHRAPPIANYVNRPGRTVRQVHEEAALQESIVNFIKIRTPALAALSPRDLHAEIQRFVADEKLAGRLMLSPQPATPIDWQLRNLLHFVGMPALFFLASPLLILLAPLFLFRLRMLENSDPELCWRVDPSYSDGLANLEDHYVTNQFTAMGSLKPGFVRLAVVIGVLWAVNWGARHLFTRGRLARIRTIHFARWVFLDDRKRMVFFSNYDGTVESYMDDFINKTGFGLNAVFSNGIGYPRTDWLVIGGCADEQKYKDFLRRHTLPTQVWYKAYPGLTAIDLERNSRIRDGLESPSLGEKEARDWAALL
ncbi:MAG TPA: hypothetical protein VGI85_03570 [Chthoniobacterales bacterium]|jgi:hypothetical protein